jgi:hypothetical protein
MIRVPHPQQIRKAAPSFSFARGDLLQRKCACGGASGECEECAQPELSVQCRRMAES